jgi:uncharacterized protein (TIGR00297 family)
VPDALTLLLGLAAGILVSLGGWKAGALAPSGAIAGTVVGFAVVSFGGVGWAAVMVAFFVLSSGLSRIGAQRKEEQASIVEKGDRRDARQVLANGGIPALLAVASRAGQPELFLAAYVGALAAATADTWSTELGALSRRPPRSIVSGRVVAPGTSGGVTPLGLAASLAGGLTVGAIAAAVEKDAALLPLGALSGLGGSVVDSLIGATIQRLFWCPRCERPTERTVHDCGTPTTRTRGFGVIDNDAVNLLASLAGAVAGLVFWWGLG